MPTLANRIIDLVDQHGSLRAVAAVKKIDAGYLSRLASGEKTNPSKAVLRKLGLLKVVNYERLAKESGNAR
jgi:transcriptional regulator with XRE-family HTH domain